MMFINPRRKKSFKKKLFIYIILFLILGFIVFIVNLFFPSQKPLFISPLGKVGLDVAKVKKSLKEKNISFSKAMGLSDSTYVVDIPNNGQVKFSANKDIDKQTTSLQRILIELTIEGKSFKMIDFRFEEPIISF